MPGSGGYEYYFPLSYNHLRNRLRMLHKEIPRLQWPFSNSIYTACTFNLGPTTATFAHLDHTNYPSTPCSIQSLGKFNPALGGHLILFDLGIFVQFPANCTALISSASLRHGNTPIQPNETRYSFTQYVVGSLIRWVTHGGPVCGLTNKERVENEERMDEGWKAQAARFSHWLDLDEHRLQVHKAEV